MASSRFPAPQTFPSPGRLSSLAARTLAPELAGLAVDVVGHVGDPVGALVG